MRRLLAGLLAAFVAVAPAARAQSIDIRATDGSCNIQVLPFAQTWFTVLVSPGAAALELGEVEFRIAGMQSQSLFLTIHGPPDHLCLLDCDLFGEGVKFGFGGCQDAPVLLFPVGILALGPVPPMTLAVLAHASPTDPAFACPSALACGDEPARVCIAGGTAYINSDGDCTVGVEQRTWSQVRRLYATN